MADVYLYEPTDITIPQLSAEAAQKKYGPFALYSWDYDQIWAGTGGFGEEIDYGYEGYGFRQGTYQGYLTGLTAWENDNLAISIDEFNIPFNDITNFTPGLPISQLGIFMGADDMIGSYGDDVLKSMGGADSLEGEAGNDKLYGGAGADVIYGGKGNDSLMGGNGSDYIEGEANNDTIKGGSGRDTLIGGSGSDVLIGGSGSDELDGGFGSDLIIGGGGGKFIYAGLDNDVDVITVLTDGNFLGRKDHAKYDDLFELGANDKIIMDVRGSAELRFTSFDAGEIDIWVDDELEAVVHGLSLGQVKAMTSLG